MNDFQEQAKNWLRNVIKQNPDKIKAGVDKAGDLIDKQTGGKYADKVDAVQQKVGGLVDTQTSEGDAQPSAEGTPEPAGGMPSSGGGGTPDAEVVGGEAPDASAGPGTPAGSGTDGGSAESEGELPGPRP
jgi:hypothetical protein